MNAAAPERAPPRRVNNRELFKKHGTAPPSAVRCPEAGNPYISDFHGFGVNSRSSCLSGAIFFRRRNGSIGRKGYVPGVVEKAIHHLVYLAESDKRLSYGFLS